MATLGIDTVVSERLEALIKDGLELARRVDELRNVDLNNRSRMSRQLDAAGDGFVASALNLLAVIFPSVDNAHRSRASTLVALRGTHAPASLTAILEAVRADLAAGVVRTVAEAARGEVFDDFLDHADHYLSGNKVAQAGVIAGVVFEDTVRRLGAKHQLAAGGKLDTMISDLERLLVLTPVKAKRARAAADVRTRATHADWDKFERDDVESTIKLTRELIEDKL